MPCEHLLVERDGSVATVTINRPAVLNALNAATLRELDGVMQDLAGDDGVRVAVLTGAGARAFAAGADIAELAAMTPQAAASHAAFGQGVLDRIECLGKPVVAAVNGFALGGGCELAMACAIRIAADSARFGQPEVRLGLMPGFGGTQRLPRLVGRGRALDLILRGGTIDAAEALRIGLVTRVVPAAALGSEARALAAEIASNAPLAVARAMEAVHRGLDATLAEGLAIEASLFGSTFGTADMREGTRAFLEKRAPGFTGT